MLPETGGFFPKIGCRDSYCLKKGFFMIKQMLTGFFVLGLAGVIALGFSWYKKNNSTAILAPARIEQTFAIIKPDAVEKKYVGQIIALIEKSGFELAALKKVQLSREEAEAFYAVHAQRPFFKELVSFMTRGPVIVMVLEKKDAVASWRELMGATNPAQAKEGTVRKQFGTDVQQNAVHGSDSLENAQKEIAFFFTLQE